MSSRLAVLLPMLFGCSTTLVVPDGRLSSRPRAEGQDQALVLVFSQPTLCSITIHDESGALVDWEERNGKRTPVDMSRPAPALPYPPYTNGTPLLLVEAMPPGRYAITGYSTTDQTIAVHDPVSGARLARNDCDDPTVHATHVPFEIRPGELRLAALDHGEPGFDDLLAVRIASQQAYVKDSARSWLPAIEEAAAKKHRALVASRRVAHDGYDVYPDCERSTAVVRTTGTPFAFVERSSAEALASFRGKALAVAPASMHANGFGHGCVTPQTTWTVYMTNAAEVDEASRRIGEWMVREDLAGEVDLMVSEVPRLL